MTEEKMPELAWWKYLLFLSGFILFLIGLQYNSGTPAQIASLAMGTVLMLISVYSFLSTGK